MRLLIVVDAQKDFIDGAFHNAEAILRVANICSLIRGWKDRVLFTKDTHFESTYANSQEGRRLTQIHCVKGTAGWEIHPDIIKAYKDTHDGQEPDVIEKYSFGLYDWVTPLLQNRLHMEDDPITEIVIVGYCTDICVISNAMILKALLPEVTIKVVDNCCAGLTPEKHQHALDVMQSCQIEVISDFNELV